MPVAACGVEAIPVAACGVEAIPVAAWGVEAIPVAAYGAFLTFLRGSSLLNVEPVLLPAAIAV
jgi:hypothetical protein